MHFTSFRRKFGYARSRVRSTKYELCVYSYIFVYIYTHVDGVRFTSVCTFNKGVLLLSSSSCKMHSRLSGSNASPRPQHRPYRSVVFTRADGQYVAPYDDGRLPKPSLWGTRLDTARIHAPPSPLVPIIT